MFDICLGIKLDCAAQRVFTEVELSQHDINHSSLKPFSDSIFITLTAFPTDKDRPYGYSYYTNEMK